MTDIIVAGGGPAGLTAALYAVRASRSVLVLEEAAPGGQINFSPLVENYPGLPGVSGLQLSEALTRQAEEQGVELDYAQVLGFRPEEGGFAVETDGGPLHCRALILAPGTRHRPLGLEGEEALTGQGVSYCAVCDGPFYQGRDTAIVGGGDTALQEALFLSGVCRRVTLIHRRLEFRGSPKLAERVRTRDNIRLLLGYTPQALLQAEGRLTGLRVRQASTGQTLELPLDGVFAAVGRVPGTAPFRAQLELALELDLPVIVHDREAHGDSLAIVKEYPALRGVFHCYSGSVEMARELLALGWYLGFDGPVTYKNARKTVEVAEMVPLDRILIETDSPYMSPVPLRGKRNDSRNVFYIAEKLAQIKGMTTEEMARLTMENGKSLFGIQ